MDVLSDLVATFEGAGLSTPPIPATFVPQLRKLGEWSYATRNLEPMDTYMLAPFVREVLQEAPVDFIAVNHAGHGVNSYSINYVLVSGPPALPLQTGWGGAYMDADRAATAVRVLFAGAASLIDASMARRLAETSGRLVVVSSDFRQISAWAWTEGPDRTLDVDEWMEEHRSLSPLADATQWVAAQS